MTKTLLPLRVAQLTEATSAGVGRHVIDCSLGLAQAGHTLHLFYSDRRIDKRFQTGLRELEEAGVRSTFIDMAHRPGPLDIAAIVRLRRALRKYGPFDLLHCHSTKAGVIGRIAAASLHLKTVYTPHAFVTMSPSKSAKLLKTLGKWTERALSSLSGGIICVSDDEYEHALSIGLSKNKLFMVHNGISLEQAAKNRSQRTEMRRSLGVEDGCICVGFVGRLTDQKAPEILVSAFAIAASKLRIPVKLVIVGFGPNESKIKAQIERLKLVDKVRIVETFDGQNAMAAFDIFALPSRYEGFPYALVEAVASGLPVVATKVGGTSVLVKENKNGLIVPIESAEAMANAITQLLSSDTQRALMSAASLEIAKGFGLAAMIDGVQKVYDKIIVQVQLPVMARAAF